MAVEETDGFSTDDWADGASRFGRVNYEAGARMH